jgi:peptidoglycan/xylan/chitin deacetylase (PgdA/CDA1 family)
LASISKTDRLHHSLLFRPPYGRTNAKQVRNIIGLGKKIIMWTWNAQDYKKNMIPETIIANANRIKGMDILLFHNSIKSKENMMKSLPSVIDIVKQKKLKFQPLSYNDKI